MKTKLTSIIIGLAMLAGISTQAQTSTNGPSIWDFATTGSNYWVAPFATMAPKSGDFGYGVAVGYKVTQVINPVLRLDSFAGKLWVVSGNLELQAPRSLLGKFPITPFAVAGVATSFGGNGQNNGAPCGVVGAGAYFDWSYLSPNSWLGKHGHTAVDYERWIGLPDKQQNQIRFAPIALSF